MPRLLIVVVLVAAVVALNRAALAGDESTPPAAECAVFVGEGDGVLVLTGVGSVVTEPVVLEAGNVVVTAEATETTWFYASFHRWPGEGGGPSAGPIDAAGRERSVERVYEAGEYVLEVDSDPGTEWTITLDWG